MLVVIPARGQSKRIPGKALKELAGKPLIVWAIDRARATGYRCLVATEDKEIVRCVAGLGVDVWIRDPATATDDAPDYSWAKELRTRFPTIDRFAVCRITSPFLRLTTHLRPMLNTLNAGGYTSIRCVTPVSQHPCKMWRRTQTVRGVPVMAGKRKDRTPYHSAPTQTLPNVYVQTAGLEITRRTTLRYSLAGNRVAIHVVTGPAALDINTPEDWARAEEIAKTWTL